MNEVQKHNSFNTNTPSSESYRNYPCSDVGTSEAKRPRGRLRRRWEGSTESILWK
jgi:hypothetical protein